MRILILGGYGTFGGRLARLLAPDSRVTLIIAGRSEAKAKAFCADLPPGAGREPFRFHRDGDVPAQISEVRPDIVVDAMGPFQSYGADPYRVVRGALALGLDYLDLADGAAFVKNISAFDAEAKARGLSVLSGVSSFPVLTAAVVRHLSPGMARIRSIAGGIAPSPYAGVGLNVIRAIASYAGRAVRLRRDGHFGNGCALTETMRYTIAPPGRLPLHSTRFSLIDVPELQLLPDLWPDLDTIWMGAGPVPEVLHRALNLLAWSVRLRLLPSLSALAPLFHHAINRLRWGEHRGGMFIAIAGERSDGVRIERSWHLLAEGDDGPLIPSMAVAAILLKRLAGQAPAPGARPATAELELGDYEPLFAGRAIYWGCRETGLDDEGMPLYHKLLGVAWGSLPEPIKEMHAVAGTLVAEGTATVERGTGLLARLIAALFQFPRAGVEMPVTVTMTARAGGEMWERRFAGRAFRSFQMAGRGRSDRLMVERFGPFTFALALVAEEGRLRLILRRWSFLGLPLPPVLAPHGEAFESGIADRFHFHVEIRHRLLGLIVRYRGSLTPRRQA
jgi:hypothetical protein